MYNAANFAKNAKRRCNNESRGFVQMFPPRSHPKWHSLLGGKDYPLKCLGLKIMLSRLRLDYQRNPKNIESSIAEIEAFAMKNMHLVKDDLRTIFG